jgi:hypothetical protein
MSVLKKSKIYKNMLTGKFAREFESNIFDIKFLGCKDGIYAYCVFKGLSIYYYEILDGGNINKFAILHSE